MENSIAIYGAYGHTVKFIVSQLCEEGYKPILCGRDKEKLFSFSQKYPQLKTKLADINQPDTLDNAFSEAKIIINCADPFLDTAEPIIHSALRLGKHYIDVTPEQKSVINTFEQFSEKAKQTEVAVIPEAAFYGGLADLLSTTITQSWVQVDDITIYIGLDSWHPTKGSRLTGERNHYQRFVFANKQLQPVQTSLHLSWNFPHPIDTKEMLAMPLSEVITISSHIAANNINTYVSKNAINNIRNSDTPEPKPTDSKNRSSQHFCMEVEAKSGNSKKRISAQGKDIYAVTAPLVVEAIKRILAGKLNKIGVTTFGETFDAADFLNSLNEEDVIISTIQEN